MVKLKEESLLVPILEGKGVDYFLGDNNIRRNVPILDESSLGLINEGREVRLKPINQGFNNNFK